jgi:type IV pilus assembly protein PilM
LFEKDTLALSIENDCIRAVQTRGRQLVRWGRRPLNPGWIQDGVVHEVQEVGTAIDGLVTEEQFSRKRLVVGITGLRAMSRIVTMPKMQGALLAGAVVREAKRELPVPLDEVYLSWQVVRDSGSQQDVFLLGVPRELVDSTVQALQIAGLRADSMEVKPLALARAVNQSRAVVVALEADSLETCIIVDDVPVVMRAVSPVGEGQAGLEKLSRMVEELSSTVRFYNDSHKDTALASDTPLYLTGELVADPALRQAMEGTFPYPIVSPESWFYCPPGFPVAQFAVSLGLAMKQS